MKTIKTGDVVIINAPNHKYKGYNGKVIGMSATRIKVLLADGTVVWIIPEHLTVATEL